MPQVSEPLSEKTPIASIPSIVLMGFNEAGLLRCAWHDLERDGRHGVPYRATTRRSEVRVQSPAGKRVLVTLLSGSPSLLEKPLAGKIRLYAIDNEAQTAKSSTIKPILLAQRSIRLSEDVWVVRRVPFTLETTKTLYAVFSIQNLITPDRVLRNGDARALGWYVSAVWIE